MTVKEEERLIGTSTKRDVSSRDESGSRSITQYSTREIQVSLKGEARVIHIKAGAGFLAWLTSYDPAKLKTDTANICHLSFLRCLVGPVARFLLSFTRPKIPRTKCLELTLGGVRTLVVTTPRSKPDKVCLYLHGGYYICKCPEDYALLCSYLADYMQATVYIPDYRLAPEHYFPAQLNDGVATYKALLTDHNIDPKHIIVGGDSAGGNLAIVMLLKLRDEGVPLPSSTFLLSPWADPSASHPEYDSEAFLARDYILGGNMSYQKSQGRKGAAGYFCQEGEDLANPYICPVLGDFTGFPPTMIQVSPEECFYVDCVALKDAILRPPKDTSSVSSSTLCVPHTPCVEFVECKGLWHVHQEFVELPEAIASIELIAQFVDRHMHRTGEGEG